MRKGIIDPAIYNNSESELMLGNLAALGGSGIWLMVATFLKLPISGTHSIVGATVGFSLVARGTRGIQWWKLASIVGSWFASPLLSGLMSSGLYLAIRRLILRRASPLKHGLNALPIFYALTLGINVFSIVLGGPQLLYMDRIPVWGTIVLSCSVGIIAAGIVQWLVVPRLRRSILEGIASSGQQDATRARFTFGGAGSGESSASVTPDDSRNVSMDDLPYGGNNVARTHDGGLSTDLHSRSAKRLTAPPPARKSKFRGFRKTQYSAAEEKPFVETPLGGIHIVPASANGGVSGSEDPTPIHGLSPCSSAVPLFRGTPTAASLNTALNNGAGGAALGCDAESGRDSTPSGSAIADDAPEVTRLFSFLQILTASFGSFAHGGNDVSNAIGPLVAIWLIFTEGSVTQKAETPTYILLYGGIGIAVGLWVKILLFESLIYWQLWSHLTTSDDMNDALVMYEGLINFQCNWRFGVGAWSRRLERIWPNWLRQVVSRSRSAQRLRFW